MITHRFIERQLTIPFLARLPSLFHSAHRLCTDVIRDNPCLAVPSLQVGDLRNAAVDGTKIKKEDIQISRAFPINHISSEEADMSDVFNHMGSWLSSLADENRIIV